MTDNGNGFFKRAAEWLVLAGIMTGWGITVGMWSSRLSNVEVSVIKTTTEVEVLKSNQVKVMSELPYIKKGIDTIQAGIEKLDIKLEKHQEETRAGK